LPDASRTAKGLPIVNVINMQPDETVTTLMKVRDYNLAKYLFFTTRQGRVKRVALDQFKSVRSTGMIAIGIDADDELAWVRMTEGEDEMVLVTSGGQAIRFPEGDVRPMGRTAAGVIGIRLDPGDRVIASDVVTPDKDLLVVSAKGLGKRTGLDQYRAQSRGGKGIQAMRLTDRTGAIVAAGMAGPDDAIMLMNNKGIAIRIAASQISRIGRTTQGVTLMRLGKTEEIVQMTVIEPKDPSAAARLNGLEDGEPEEESAS
ncbi:MAG TPA: DNA gyrase C-terminal beta-propeller domain-containing protein, partial [Thermomicrobiales bacterium]|nr:DNA gyrase C-terminal beta-propeller domain-containing protein [Thermomicrobiales bacterium]